VEEHKEESVVIETQMLKKRFHTHKICTNEKGTSGIGVDASEFTGGSLWASEEGTLAGWGCYLWVRSDNLVV
jgi:hypothetical protein